MKNPKLNIITNYFGNVDKCTLEVGVDNEVNFVSIEVEEGKRYGRVTPEELQNFALDILTLLNYTRK
jgi:hypothetical protein